MERADADLLSEEDLRGWIAAAGLKHEDCDSREALEARYAEAMASMESLMQRADAKAEKRARVLEKDEELAWLREDTSGDAAMAAALQE